MRKIIIFTIASIMFLGSLVTTAQAGTYYYVTGRRHGNSPRNGRRVYAWVRARIYEYYSPRAHRRKKVVKQMWWRFREYGSTFYVVGKNELYYYRYSLSYFPTPSWTSGRWRDYRDVVGDTGWIYGGCPNKTFYANQTIELWSRIKVEDTGSPWSINVRKWF